MKEQNLPDRNYKPHSQNGISKEIPDNNDMQKRIVALKQRTTPTQANAQRFSYDPTQPLHLPLNMRKGESEK